MNAKVKKWFPVNIAHFVFKISASMNLKTTLHDFGILLSLIDLGLTSRTFFVSDSAKLSKFINKKKPYLLLNKIYINFSKIPKYPFLVAVAFKYDIFLITP